MATADDVKPVDSARSLSRIAFGSCARQSAEPQAIWDVILAQQPDMFLMIGDNIYGDTADMEVMKAKYALLGAQAGFQRLRTACPLLATWDDHDYGLNDGGAEFPQKKASQQVFLDFFDGPDSPRRKREGVYDAKVFGPEGRRVQIILLDTRYFRSALKKGPGPGKHYLPLDDPQATMLGEAQWNWLAEQLRQPAELRIIASSIQVVPEDHVYEKWNNLPLERERLFRTIREAQADGVLFISGDRHLAELSMMDGGIGYPVYDLTASSFTHSHHGWRAYEANRHRVATMNAGENFGLIRVDWEAPDPLIRLQIYDVEGEVTIQHKLTLGTLRRGIIPEASAQSK